MKKQEAKEKSKGLDHEELCKKITEMHEWIMKHSPEAFAEGGRAKKALVSDDEIDPATPQGNPAVPAPQAAPVSQPADPENPPVTDFNLPDNVSQSLNAPSPTQALDNAHDEAVAAGPSKQYLVDQYDKYKQDLLNGHITPKTYADLYADKGTLGKVGTLFGLLVSGAGSGLSGQKNAVLDMMDKVIQNDINSQIHSKENALNFLRVNQADLKNKVDAMGSVENAKTAALARTQAQVYQTTLHDLIEKAKKLPPSQQGAVQQVLTTISTRAFEKINNIHDLSAVAMAVNGRNPFQSQGQQQPAQGETAPQSPKEKKEGNSAAVSQHFLAPGATQSFTTAQYKPEYNDDKEDVKGQLKRAGLADKAIDAIYEHFPQMFANIKNVAHPTGDYGPKAAQGNALERAVSAPLDKAADLGSDVSGYIHRRSEDFGGVPYIGKAIQGLGTSLTNTQKNRDYDVHRAAVTTALMPVLTAAGMTPTDAEHALDSILPEEGDDINMARNKIKAAVEKIKQTVPTEALERHRGLLRKK